MLARIFLPQKVRHIWFTFIPTFKFLITSRLHDVLAKKGVTQPPGSCDQYTVPWFYPKMAENSVKSTPCWQLTWPDKSDCIIYVIIGVAPSGELIDKVNRDSLLFLFRCMWRISRMLAMVVNTDLRRQQEFVQGLTTMK